MQESQRITRKRAELSARVNDMLVEARAAGDDASLELQGRIDAGQRQIAQLDRDWIEATDREDKETQVVMSNHVDADGLTPRLRGLKRLAQRAHVGHYIDAVAHDRALDGAAKEYAEEVLGTADRNKYPLEMLLDRDERVDMSGWEIDGLIPPAADDDGEERTLITGVAQTHGDLTFMDRIFAMTDGAYVGASYPVVSPGRKSFPIVTGTTVASAYSRGSDETPSGGLTVVDADPERIQHSYQYATVDELDMPGVAAYLAADLRMSLMAGLDNKVIDDLLSALGNPSTTTTVITLSTALGKFGDAVDGVAAKDVRDVRFLVGTNTYGVVSGLTISNIGHFNNLMPHDRFRASSHIAAPVSQNQAAVAYRTGAGMPRRLIVPMYRRGELLRDMNSRQTRGEVVLTGAMYADVILVNSDLHKEETFHLA